MKYVCCLALVISIGLIALMADRGLQATAVPAPSNTPYKWEYRAVTETDLVALTEQKTIEAGMNKLGDEGWELVAIKAASESTIAAKKNPQSLFCFKRLKTGK